MTIPTKSICPIPEHETLMKIRFHLNHDQVLLLPTAAAAELVKLLGTAYMCEEAWNSEVIKLDFQPKKPFFIVTPINMEQVTNTIKAQVLGIPYDKYIEQLNKEKNNEIK